MLTTLPKELALAYLNVKSGANTPPPPLQLDWLICLIRCTVQEKDLAEWGKECAGRVKVLSYENAKHYLQMESKDCLEQVRTFLSSKDSIMDSITHLHIAHSFNRKLNTLFIALIYSNLSGFTGHDRILWRGRCCNVNLQCVHCT